MNRETRIILTAQSLLQQIEANRSDPADAMCAMAVVIGALSARYGLELDTVTELAAKVRCESTVVESTGELVT